MLARRLTVIFALVPIVVALGAGAAHAEDLVPAPNALSLTAPAMSVRLTSTATTQTVCGTGALRSTTPTTNPTWRMTTVGVRSNGTLISDSKTFLGPSFSYCYAVAFQGTLSGNFTTIVAYTGIGDDYPSALVGDGVWHDGQTNEWEMSQ